MWTADGEMELLGVLKTPSQASAVLVLGLQPLEVITKRGFLWWPAFDVPIAGLVTDPSGHLVLGATWPAGVPSGLTLWMQFWYAAPPSPVAASNGLRVTTP